MKRGKVRLNLPSSPSVTSHGGANGLAKSGSTNFNNPRISPPGRGRPSGPSVSRVLAPTPSRLDTVDSDLAVSTRNLEDVSYRLCNPAGPDLRPTLKYEEITVRGDLGESERLSRREVQAPASYSFPAADESRQAPVTRLREMVPISAQEAGTLAPPVNIETILSAAYRRDVVLFGSQAGTATDTNDDAALVSQPVTRHSAPVANQQLAQAEVAPPAEAAAVEAPCVKSSGHKVRLNLSQTPTITHVVEDEERVPPPERSIRSSVRNPPSTAQPEEEEDMPPEVTAAIQRMRRERGEVPLAATSSEVAMSPPEAPPTVAQLGARPPAAGSRSKTRSTGLSLEHPDSGPWLRCAPVSKTSKPRRREQCRISRRDGVARSNPLAPLKASTRNSKLWHPNDRESHAALSPQDPRPRNRNTLRRRSSRCRRTA
jgi:hypothetical protein